MIGCEEEELPRGKLIYDPLLTEELLGNSFDTLSIDSYHYFLNVWLNRDFMPICPPDGRPLVCLNCLISMDSTVIPQNIDIIKQYVINNDTIWIKQYVDEDEREEMINFKLCKVAGDGPMWNPGIFVDVIVEVYDSRTDSTHFVRALEQYINKSCK